MDTTNHAHEGEAEVGGGEFRRAREEIEAEIADHLAMSAWALRAGGVDAAEAERVANTRFGDVSKIIRQCWWIQKGGDVMLRALGITAAVLAAAAVCMLGVFTWRSQQQMAVQMQAMTANLAAVQAKQTAALEEMRQSLVALRGRDASNANEAAIPGEITGYVYLGDPKLPAKDAEVEIRQLPTGDVVRRVRSDERGNFTSGALPEGEYFVMAPLATAANPLLAAYVPLDARRAAVQSRPVLIDKGTKAQIDLDVECAVGELVFRLAGEIPTEPFEEFPDFSVAIGLAVTSNSQRILPWKPDRSLPPQWPVRGMRSTQNLSGWVNAERFKASAGSVWSPREWDWSPSMRPGVEAKAPLVVPPHLPSTILTGTYTVRARVCTATERSPPPSRPYNNRPDQATWSALWTAMARSGSQANAPAAMELTIAPDERVLIELDGVDGYIARVRSALASEPINQEALSAAVTAMPLTMTVISTEPIATDD